MTSRFEFADYSSPNPIRKQQRRRTSNESLSYSCSSHAGESSDSSVGEFDDDNRRNHQNEEASSYTSDSLKYSEVDEPSGQKSDGNGNHGAGNRYANSTELKKLSFYVETKKEEKSKKEIISPATVTPDRINTPSSPPPRHYNRREITETATEVWYAKWWMCGFTDSLNVNENY